MFLFVCKYLFHKALSISLTHKVKTSAMPRDSSRFDLCFGRCEFLISTKKTEIHNERISELEPYEMGLQVPYGIYINQSDASKKYWY